MIKSNAKSNRKTKDHSKDPTYIAWFRSAERNLTEKDLRKIESRVKEEVELLLSLTPSNRLIYLKKIEIENWLPSQSIKDLLWVERTIFKTKGRSDFRRIDPELIEIHDDFELSGFNIWGEPHNLIIKNRDSQRSHWEILRTLVSSAPNDGAFGQQLRFLVIDKTTRKYLGIICLTQGMFEIRSIHDEIGWDREKIQSRKKSRELPGNHNLINGQTIVPTQPFGNNFLGGKLMALLCLSKEVVETYEEKYGIKVVQVHTTSLFGDKDASQYTNLSPYWREHSERTSGVSPIKLTATTYELARLWLKHKHPEKYWHIYEHKKPDGTPAVRENKKAGLLAVYRGMGIKEFNSNEPRGVYSSFLYSNAIPFLNERIAESELIPAFDNSIKALTEFWRFGSMGDTTKASVEMRVKVDKATGNRKEKELKRLQMKVEMKGQVKGRIDAPRRQGQLPQSGKTIDWYLPLKDLTWEQIRNIYCDPPEASETQSSVQPVSDPG